MNKENKNEKELSEEEFGKVSGGGNFRPGFKISRDVLGIGRNPKDLCRPIYIDKKGTNPLPNANPKKIWNLEEMNYAKRKQKWKSIKWRKIR